MLNPVLEAYNLQLFRYHLEHQFIKISILISSGAFPFVFPAIAIRRYQGPSMLGGFHLASSWYLIQETPSWM